MFTVRKVVEKTTSLWLGRRKTRQAFPCGFNWMNSNLKILVIREVSHADEYGYGYEYVITFCAPCDVKRFYTRFHTRMQRISAVIRVSKKRISFL